MTATPPTMRAITRAVCERLAQAGAAYWPGEDGDYTLTPGGPPPVYAKRSQSPHTRSTRPSTRATTSPWRACK